MSKRLVFVAETVLVAVLATALAAPDLASAGAVDPAVARKLFETVRPSLVVVKYTWESELGRRELAGAGIVVREDGLVVCQLALFHMSIPDEQLKEFKLVIPDPSGNDPDELDATLLGRDERYALAFLQPKKSDINEDGATKDGAARKWKPIKFEDVEVNVGDPVISVGLMPEQVAYKTYVMETAVAVTLRGEQPQVLVQGGGLTGIGSPVFTPDGRAIGIVNFQPGQLPFLNDPATALSSVTNPPRFFLLARDFLPALAEPPAEGKPVVMPWIGIPQSTGLNKDVSEVLGLTNRPAIEVGEVIPDAPAAKAGVKRGDIIVEIDGKPLERGDEPDELTNIFRRQVVRMKVGQTIKLGVLRGGKGQPLQQIEVKTEESPRRPHSARRWFAEDLGFSAREVVFSDTYARRLAPDAKGVIVALIRPQSAAESGRLKLNDMITELNREPVTDLDGFRKSYEEFRKGKPKDAVVMVVLREGQTQTIRIEPPQ